ncbi:ABC transporter permease [Corynebacterium diphtheriae]|uniref:ABC transporter permease n=1 Tax=Corynebacterium diphtheriae TaxID=1717 RepID=UPI00217DB264|nr:ABC transporter permease [Corynebacterium diphtheriae]
MTNHTTATVSHDTTWLSTVATHFGRHLRAARRDSAVITNTVAGPVLMFLVMRWLFGDLMAASQGSATLDALPLTIALILSSELMNGTSAAAQIIKERQRGITTRIATTRYGTSPEIFGRWCFDSLRSLISGCAVLLASVASGLRIHTLAGFGWVLLVIIFGAVVAASLSAMVGAMCATPEAAIGPAPIIMAAWHLTAASCPWSNSLVWFNPSPGGIRLPSPPAPAPPSTARQAPKSLPPASPAPQSGLSWPGW